MTIIAQINVTKGGLILKKSFYVLLELNQYQSKVNCDKLRCISAFHRTITKKHAVKKKKQLKRYTKTSVYLAQKNEQSRMNTVIQKKDKENK